MIDLVLKKDYSINEAAKEIGFTEIRS
jgi:hypothetical protein